MQVSSNLMLITSKTGETASFPCDLTQGATYIHLYKHEEGMAPRRLLYYDSYNSKPVLESGISGAKYHVYKGTGRSYTLQSKICKQVIPAYTTVLSGISTLVQTSCTLHWKFCLWLKITALISAAASLPPAQFLFTLNKEKPWTQCLWIKLYILWPPSTSPQ